MQQRACAGVNGGPGRGSHWSVKYPGRSGDTPQRIGPTMNRAHMNKAIWIVVAIATVIAVATLVFLYGRMPQLPETEDTAAPQPSAPAPPAAEPPAAEPDIRYPIPAPEVTEPPPPLPALDESDGAIRDSLAQSFGETHVEAFLVPTQIIRHFVATIDSLDRDPVPLPLPPDQICPRAPSGQGRGRQDLPESG